MYSCPDSIQRCRRWRPWPGFRDRKGNHSWFSSVRSVEAAKSSSEVVVSKADSLVASLSIGWIVFYVNSITENSAAVLSPPLTFFAWLSVATFLLCWFCSGDNQTTYKRRYSQWERSFLCQRCGHFSGAGIGFLQRQTGVRFRFDPQ